MSYISSEKLEELLARCTPEAFTLANLYEYEPPRTARGVKNGAKRLRALGNCNPPQQYGPAILFISSLADMLREADKKEE